MQFASTEVHLIVIKLKNSRKFTKSIFFVLGNIFIDCSYLWSNEESLSEYVCMWIIDET